MKLTHKEPAGPRARPTGEDIQAFLDQDLRLREHQRHGIRFLLDHLLVPGSGCILADYMGLGKTAQAIRACDFLHQWCAFRTVFVCPKSLVTQWNSEIREWSSSGTDWARVTSYEAAGG